MTVFDEIALMNDINATWGSGVAKSKTNPEVVIQQLIEARLKKLSELKDTGLINEQEYISQKRRILVEV